MCTSDAIDLARKVRDVELARVVFSKGGGLNENAFGHDFVDDESGPIAGDCPNRRIAEIGEEVAAGEFGMIGAAIDEASVMEQLPSLWAGSWAGKK